MTTISGTLGDDTLSGTSKADVITAGAGNDRIDAGAGDDRIDAGAGNDRVDAGSGNDTVMAGSGNDTVFAGSGNDTVDGGSGNDWIDGGTGNDFLSGGDGQDLLNGGTGDDTLVGGADADRLTGGSGNDTFVFLAASDSTTGSWDRITDFDQGHDKIDLSALLGPTDLAWGGKTAIANGAWYQNSGSSTFVFADVTGDGKADLKIELKNTSGLTLTSNDFIGVSNPPVAVADTATTDEDTPVTIDVLANDRGSGNQGQNDSHDYDHDDHDGHDDFDYRDDRDDHDEHGHRDDEGHGDKIFLTSFTQGVHGGVVTRDDNGTPGDQSDDKLLYDPHGQFEYLAVGEKATDTFTYTISDGQGGTDTATVTENITGVNDAPVITSPDQLGAVSEGDDGASRSASGQVTFSDVDTHDTHALTVSIAAGHGTASVDADGTWHYTVSDSGAVDALAVDEHLSDSFTVQVDDHHGGLATQVVSIDIVGTNDAPVITSGAQSGSVSEGDDSASMSALGQVTFTDVDLSDAHALTVSVAAGHGTASVDADGTWHYAVSDSGEVDALAVGEHLSDSFTAQVNDHHGGTATQVVSIDIVGTNDAPEITSKAQSGKVSEGDPLHGANMTATGHVTYMDVDTSDTHSLSVSSNPAYGTASVDADGTWHYAVSDSGEVDALAVGEHLDDSFKVQVDDYNGGFATQVVNITITGTNDAPVITSPDHVSVGEGTFFVTDVIAHDIDHGHSLTFSIVGGADEAKFSIDPHSGALTFNDPPVFDHPTDVGRDNIYDVNVQVLDEHGAPDMQSIAVTVTVPNVLFTDSANTVNFNTVVAGTYVPGTQYDALGGDDFVTLPNDAAHATAAGYNATQTFHGGAGDDTITGGGLDDIIDGGPGNDSIDGGAGTDTASCASVGSVAGVYVDLSLGFAYDRTSDTTDTLTSIENVTGSAFNDLLVGDGGANVLDGGAGQDELYGGDGNDVLIGGLDADHLEGGAGDDTLYGGDGNDALFGGDGNDVLFGNAGNDTFKYIAPTDAGTTGDVIRDFQKGSDVLDLQDLLATFNVNGYTPATAFDGGYLNFKHENGNTVVQVDSDGTAGSADTFETLVTLDGVILNMNDTGDYIL